MSSSSKHSHASSSDEDVVPDAPEPTAPRSSFPRLRHRLKRKRAEEPSPLNDSFTRLAENLLSIQESLTPLDKDSVGFLAGPLNEIDRATCALKEHVSHLLTLNDALARVAGVPLSSAPLGYFSMLPNEALLYILSHLSADDLTSFSLTCRTSRVLSEDDSLWKRLYHSQFSFSRMNFGRSRHDDARQSTPSPSAIVATPPTTPSKYAKSAKRKRTSWKSNFLERLAIQHNWLSENVDVRNLRHHSGGIWTNSLFFDDSRLVTGGADGKIFVHRCDWAEREYTLHYALDTHVTCLTVQDDMLVSGGNGEVTFWDLTTGEKTKETPNAHLNTVLQTCCRDNLLASCGRDNCAKLWDMNTMNTLTEIHHSQTVGCVSIDRVNVITGSDDQLVKIVDLCTLTEKGQLSGHMSWVTCMHVLPEEHLMVTGSGTDDHAVRVWDLRIRKKVMEFNEHTEALWAVQWNGNLIASAGGDKAIHIWDVRGKRGLVTTFGGSPPGDGDDPRSGTRASEAEAHTDWITALQFDHRKIITGSKDTIVKVWNVDSIV